MAELQDFAQDTASVLRLNYALLSLSPELNFLCFFLGKEKTEKMEQNEQSCQTSVIPHPDDSANWLSRLTLHWMNKVLRQGSQRPLEKEDIFTVRKQDSMEHLVDKLEKLWQQEITRSRLAGCQPRLWRAFSRMFSWKQYTGMLILKTLRALSVVFLPLLLWFFLSDLENESQRKYSVSSFVFVAGMILLAFIKGLSKNHFSALAEIWGTQLKVASIGLVYKKVSVDSHNTEFHKGSGEFGACFLVCITILSGFRSICFWWFL